MTGTPVPTTVEATSSDTDRVAVVTGASGGIGRAVAQRLARDQLS